MKKLITVLLLLLFIGNSFSQSKKQQIETLTNKLDSINSILIQSIDSLEAALLIEKNNALKIEKCKSELEEKALVIDKFVNESEDLKQTNERLAKRIIHDSLKNNEKKENPTNKLNVGLCYSNHKTDEFQKYVLIQINNRLYELSVNGYLYTITCKPDDNNIEITSNAEELSGFCETYNITEKVNQLLKVNFQGENFRVFWLLNESTNKIEVFSIIEGEGRDGKTELIGTFPYNPD